MPSILRTAALLLALALASGCATRGPMVAPLPACTPDRAPTAGWETRRETLFTFAIPPGLRYAYRTGIDSGVETYTGRGLRVSHEQGPYAGPSPGAGKDQRNYSECTTMIGGREAHVATWNTPRGGFALHAAWRRIAPAGPEGDTNLAISIRTESSSPRDQAVAYAIIHSVRFP